MTVIRPNSVAGINSITAQANDLTLYTVSGASGNLNVNKVTVGSATTITAGGINVTGVVTATSFSGDLTANNVVAGVITATTYVGVPEGTNVLKAMLFV